LCREVIAGIEAREFGNGLGVCAFQISCVNMVIYSNAEKAAAERQRDRERHSQDGPDPGAKCDSHFLTTA